jgi:anti-sigma-K factor RskA
MTHEELSTLVPLYALDALEGAEHAAVEAHLGSCDECLAGLDRSRAVAASLVPDSAPPSGVWDRIAAEIDRLSVPGQPNVISIDSGRRRRERRWGLIAGVAAAAALVLAGLVVAQRTLISDLTGDSAIVAAAERALGEPGTFVDDFLVEGEAVAKVVLTGDGRGYVLPTESLPALSADRAYQLWVINDERAVISAGVLGHTPAPATFTWTGTVTGFALTREIAGGVVSSEGDVVSVISEA